MLVNEPLGGSRPSLLHFPHDLPTTLGAGGLHLRAHRLHQRSHWCPAPTDGRGELNTEFGAQSGPILTGPTCFWNFNGEKRKVMVNHEILVFTILNEAHFVFVDAHETKHGLMFFLSFFFGRQWLYRCFGPNKHSFLHAACLKMSFCSKISKPSASNPPFCCVNGATSCFIQHRIVTGKPADWHSFDEVHSHPGNWTSTII